VSYLGAYGVNSFSAMINLTNLKTCGDPYLALRGSNPSAPTRTGCDEWFGSSISSTQNPSGSRTYTIVAPALRPAVAVSGSLNASMPADISREYIPARFRT